MFASCLQISDMSVAKYGRCGHMTLFEVSLHMQKKHHPKRIFEVLLIDYIHCKPEGPGPEVINLSSFSNSK